MKSAALQGQSSLRNAWRATQCVCERAVAQIRMALLEASLVLNKAASRQECCRAFRLYANAVQDPKLLQPEGLRLHGLPAELATTFILFWATAPRRPDPFPAIQRISST